MAVAVDLEFDGGTLEQYDEVAKLMDYEPGGCGPAGLPVSLGRAHGPWSARHGCLGDEGAV